MKFEMRFDRVRIPRLHLKTNMIHVRCGMVRLITALLAQWSISIDQID